MIGRVRTIAFDKTGTLTQGAPRVTDVVPIVEQGLRFLGLAASVESASSHPLGRAIMDRANVDAVEIPPSTGARAIPGKAVEATVNGRSVVVGSPCYATERASLAVSIRERIAALEDSGKTVVVVIEETRVLGLIALRDEPRGCALRPRYSLGIRRSRRHADRRQSENRHCDWADAGPRGPGRTVACR